MSDKENIERQDPEEQEAAGTAAEDELKEPEEQTAGAEGEAAEEEAAEEADTPEGSAKEAEAPEGSAGEEAGEAAGEEAGEEKKGFFKKKEKKDKKDEKIEDLTDRLKRQLAEFDNFRKRSEKEKAAMFEMGEKSAVEKILPVVDNFERGLAGADPEDAFAVGMEMVYRQLMSALESMDVKPIEAVGKEFDPDFHNAVMHVEDENVGENIVVEELQKGYMYHDSVVRHSMVKVAN